MNKLFKQTSLGVASGIAIAMLIPMMGAAQAASSQSAGTTAPTAKDKTTSSAKAVSGSGKAGAAASAQDSVEYKDPEDMTTRYRPGNNKTTSVPANASLPAAAATGSSATGTDAKKHISNVKYADKQATVPAPDAASKDSAKSKTAPAANPGAGSSTTPDGAHKNKVDSFTVKQ